jgi:MFS family permease
MFKTLQNGPIRMRSLQGSKMLMSVIFVSFFFILGPAVTGALRPLYFVEVGADPVQLGLLMAVPSIVSIFTRVPSSAISRRLGRWRMMLFTLTLMLTSTAFFAFVLDPFWFFPLVILGAFSWAAFSPLAVELVLDQSTPNTRGGTMGLYFTSIGAAMFVGPLISSVLTTMMDLRQLFLVSTVIPLLSLAVFLVVIKPGEVKRDEVEEENEGGLRSGSISRILRVRNFASLSVARVAYALSMGIFSTVYAVYAEGTLGFTASTISLLFTFRGITNVLIRMPAGRLSDRIGRRRPFIFAMALSVVVYALLGTVGSFGPLIVIMSLFGIAWGMRIAPSMALVSDSVLEEDRPLALVLFMTMFDIGSAMGSLLAGFSSFVLTQQTLLMMCAPILLGALTVFILFSKEVDHA